MTRSIWQTLAERVNLLRGHALDCPCDSCWALRGAANVAGLVGEGVVVARTLHEAMERPRTPPAPPPAVRGDTVTVTVNGVPVEAEWIEAPIPERTDGRSRPHTRSRAR